MCPSYIPYIRELAISIHKHKTIINLNLSLNPYAVRKIALLSHYSNITLYSRAVFNKDLSTPSCAVLVYIIETYNMR